MYMGSPLHSKWFEPLSTYSLKVFFIYFMMSKLYKQFDFVDNEYRFFLFFFLQFASVSWIELQNSYVL